MADVVISYDHRDHAEAAALAQAIEGRGLTVWWDRKLIGGSRWAKVILEQLNAAQAVLVIWSRHSVHSEFVEDEARHALASDKLVPLRTDDVEIRDVPLGLRGREILPLTDMPRIIEAVEERGVSLIAAELETEQENLGNWPPVPQLPFRNCYEFRPEAERPMFVEGIRTLPIWREDIQEGVDSICFARLKKASYKGGGTVFIPDDEEHLCKIAWGSRDLGPTIIQGRVVAASIVSANVSGKRHIFLKAPYTKGTEMLWRINTGLWGDADEVRRVEALMRASGKGTPAIPLFHGCFHAGDTEDKPTFYVESGRGTDVVLANGSTVRVVERRASLWRTFDGLTLAVVGCIPDSGYILINDKGKVRIERPTDQMKFRQRIEDYVWSSRETAATDSSSD